MKVIVPIIFLLLLSCSNHPEPGWISNQSHAENYWFGVGSVEKPFYGSDIREEARSKALSEIASQISVDVLGTFEQVITEHNFDLDKFAKSIAVDYPLLYGGAREMNKIMKDYGGVYAVPSSFLVDKNGNIVWSYPGAILKNYDPQTFATLLYEIEKELKKGEVENPVEE